VDLSLRESHDHYDPSRRAKVFHPTFVSLNETLTKMAPFPRSSGEKPRTVQTTDVEASEQRSVEYKHPSYSGDQVLCIADAKALGTELLAASTTVRQPIFAPGVDVNE
jgi:hypothetical protein